MKLLAFRVREFRSVDDTGWIDANQVTALIGTNEAGKTNVLTPLWKLNPAKDGDIDSIHDYPRKRYNTIREMKRKPIFIDARFELPAPLAKSVSKLLKVSIEQVREAVVSRDFDGTYFVRFRMAGAGPIVERDAVAAELKMARYEISEAIVREEELELKRMTEGAIQQVEGLLAGDQGAEIEGTTLDKIEAALAAVDLDDGPKFSSVTGRFGQLCMMVTGLSMLVGDAERQSARDLVVKNLPSFVYYSNFGNLDAEIYLPHVIENMKRTDLGSKEAAKARTLKVLFDFVKVSPEEILALGQQADISTAAAQTKEREILLQSAATDLTRRFKEWWKQGSYVFRFQADGDHFRIWVSDGKRPEPIELESRSTGLQFFLSFYLVFIVESEDAHLGSILLLDEPGLSLHPLAQRDLSGFFDGLSATNQLIYTTHSPFMVDTDRLGRVRSVYSDDNGVTQVTAALRAPADKSDQAKSMYVSYAAVAMSAADAVIHGCQPVIVESAADQQYFTAINVYLIRHGHLRPTRDILFMAGGNAEGATTLAGLVRGSGEPLPFVVLDADAEGRTFAHGLVTGLYNTAPSRVLSAGDFNNIVDAEVEDLLPKRLLAKVFDRYVRKPGGVEDDFEDVVKDGQAFVPQAEEYARRSNIPLDDTWRLDFARRVKTSILKSKGDALQGEPAYLEMWLKIFALIHPAD